MVRVYLALIPTLQGLVCGYPALLCFRFLSIVYVTDSKCQNFLLILKT